VVEMAAQFLDLIRNGLSGGNRHHCRHYRYDAGASKSTPNPDLRYFSR
jgi:hypothetical protein